jgi:hypothetical protein
MIASASGRPLSGGANRLIAHNVTAKKPAATSVALTAQRKCRERPNRRIGAVR